MSQFQLKYFDEKKWKEVSERIVLEKLMNEFGQVTPFLTQMAQGQEITLPDCIFRMKNSGNNRKGYLTSLPIIPEEKNNN